MVSVSKYEAKEHSLGVGTDGHARGRYILQDDAAFYRITSATIRIFVEHKIATATQQIQKLLQGAQPNVPPIIPQS